MIHVYLNDHSFGEFPKEQLWVGVTLNEKISVLEGSSTSFVGH